MHKTTLIVIILIIGNIFSSGWKEVWSDEFDYAGLPSSDKWGYDVGGSGWGNNEAQYYTQDRLENARVENGQLIIEAHKEVMENCQYTSARLVSKGKGDWLYGKIEIKAKMPPGRGSWPALWMLPTDWEYGSWPKSGELDILEHVGYDLDRVHVNIHTEAYNHTKDTNKGNNVVVDDVVNKWHIYALEWDAEYVRYLIDDQEIFVFNNEHTGYTTWPFDKRFHLIMNIAIGGDWGAVQGIDDDIFPIRMLIDYVRVYEWDNNPGPYTINIDSSEGGNVTLSPALSQYDSGTNVTITANPESDMELERWSGDFEGKDSSFTISINKDIMSSVFFRKKGEMLLNSKFNDNDYAWNFGSFNPGIGTGTIQEGEYHCAIENGGTETWHVQMSQSGITLTQDSSYTLTFNAYATEPRSIICGIGKNYDPWSGLIMEEINLTTTPTQYSITGIMENVTDNNCRVYFDCGADNASIIIDNVSLMKNSNTQNNHSNIKRISMSMRYSKSGSILKVTSPSAISELSIYSLVGKKLFHKENGNHTDLYSIQVDLSQLAEGSYIVSAKTHEGMRLPTKLILH